MVNDHSDSEKGNLLPPHRLLLSIIPVNEGINQLNSQLKDKQSDFVYMYFKQLAVIPTKY